MPLVSAVSGPYTSTLGAVDLGVTQDGFRLLMQVSKEAVRGDKYGDSIIDYVYRGGNVNLIARGIEYTKMMNAFWPYGSLGVMGQAGRMDQASSLTGSAVLTAVAGTPAASTPASLTGQQSTVDQNFRGDLEFASKLRSVPLGLSLLPYSSGGNVVWFTTA